MNKYLDRYIEKTIERKLKTSGAVLVRGPKFCGKTTTCRRFAKSELQLGDNNVLLAVASDPKGALHGEYPRLIDEWQNFAPLWDYIRVKVDDDSAFGEFLLTGSVTLPNIGKIHHSGAGRIVSVDMRPMSLFESGDSKGNVCLKSMFDDIDYAIFDLNEDYRLSKTAFFICRGGWPLSISADDENEALEITENYYNGLFNLESSDNEEYRRKKPDTLKKLLASYARNISTEASYKTMIDDMSSDSARRIDDMTFSSYLEMTKELFIIEDLEPWSPNLRSKTAIRSTPTRHFVDTSIAALALGVTPNALLNDGNLFGFFFEDLAVRDLRIYSETLGGSVMHYRDANGLECDAIIRLKDGRWGAIEIKLGSPEGIEAGIKNLNKLESILDPKYPKPSFKMVLTAVGQAYRRKEDGIYIVPINLLKA